MKRILLAAIAVAALTACGTESEPAAESSTTTASETTTLAASTTAPSSAAPTTESLAESELVGNMYLETCNELLPMFAARAELGGTPANQTEFAEAMLEELKQSAEWANASPDEQSEAARGVHAAASGEC